MWLPWSRPLPEDQASKSLTLEQAQELLQAAGGSGLRAYDQQVVEVASAWAAGHLDDGMRC